MGNRLDLQTLLETITTNVYFQPPATFIMQYPCIVYKRSSGKTQFADDNPYIHKTKYALTVIDKNPDSEILSTVSKLPMCTFEQHFTMENLNHDIFNLYY